MTSLHHEIAGHADAPVLLMGSSLGTDGSMWEGQLPLSADLRLIRFDHRGHGRSPVPPGPYEIADLAGDVIELMDRLELERASFCGLSIGGMVGMRLAIDAPERIDRLILICTAAHLGPSSAWLERAAVVRDAGSVEPIADAVVGRWLTPGYAAAHPVAHSRLRAMLASSPVEGYACCCEAISRWDARAELARITAPTLVISGAQDLATPVEKQEVIARAIPGSRHEILSPAAHIAAIEQAPRINELIGEHLR